MALNKYMHPRNIYKTRKPDFKQLALKYEYFRERVTQNLNGKVILDFKDPASLRALTQALLEDDFGLHVTLPVDRLIPTVPQRLNYILWLEDIIGVNTPAKGVDIGTGASCIYPLLGCKQNGWEFLASEVDDQNLLFATENLKKNKMEEKIKIKKVEEDKLLLGVVEDLEKYDFCMCNPPFFSDHLEAQGITATRSDDRPDPKSMSTASEKESIAWGGEVRFVCQMIEESLVLKDKIRVYTSMLGKKMSLSLIKDQLAKKKITRFASTEFCQGRTMRWGIAWTFDDNLHFPKSAFKTLKKPVVPLTFEVPRNMKAVTEYTVQAFTEFVRTEIEGLKINYYVKHSGKFYTYLILQAKDNTWSHQRRKRRKEKFAAMSSNLATEVAETNVLSTETNTQQSNNNENQSNICKDLNEPVSSKTADDIGSVKEMKNVRNMIERNERKVNDEILNYNIDNDLSLKRKREDMSEGESSKKCKTDSRNTQDKPVNLDTDKESSTCDRNCNKCMETQVDAVSKNGNIDSPKPLQSILINRDSEMKDVHLCLDQDKPSTMSELESNQTQQNGFNKPNSDEDNTFPSVFEPKKEGVSDSNMADDQIDKDTQCNSAEKDQSNMKETDSNKMPSRAEIVSQFWDEKEANKKKPGGKKRAPHSIHERMELFDKEEDCVVLLKLMIRKDEGTVTFNFTYIAGMKEAVHQIMQYFRNKLL